MRSALAGVPPTSGADKQAEKYRHRISRSRAKGINLHYTTDSIRSPQKGTREPQEQRGAVEQENTRKRISRQREARRRATADGDQ